MNFLPYITQTRFLFHAHIKIKIPAQYPETLFDEFFGTLEKIDKSYNSWQPDSYIDRINKQAGKYVPVDRQTCELLKTVVGISDLFDGTYDITVMPLLKLWGFFQRQKRIPDENEIREAKEKVGYKNIEISGERVRIPERYEITTGSFLKAFAVDQLIRKISGYGIPDVMINAGGSTIRTVNPSSQAHWQVRIHEPLTKKELYTLILDNRCLSTSSSDHQYILHHGKRLSHIIDPLTGYPSQNLQVGIISDNCMIGDIVSTALFCETPENFLAKIKLLSSKFGIEGYIIDKYGTIRVSEGFSQLFATKSISL